MDFLVILSQDKRTSQICVHLKVNGENWVPVVIGDLRNDALHDGKWQAPKRFSQNVRSPLFAHHYLQIFSFQNTCT